MTAGVSPRPNSRVIRAAVYLTKAALIAVALVPVIALVGTVLGTTVGILLVEWSSQ